MPDNEQSTPAVPTPDNVYVGTRGFREMTPEQVRHAAASESELLTQVAGSDGAAGYKEAVSRGDRPTDLFTRTEFKSIDDVKFNAVAWALEAPRLRLDPNWADEEWVHMPPVSAALYLEAVFMKSLDRQSLKEATMGMVGMIAPDMWPEGPERRRRFVK